MTGQTSGPTLSVFYEKLATARAGLSYWPPIRGEVALGKVIAAIEYLPLLTDSFHEFTATLGAWNAGFDRVGPGGFTVRIATAGEKFAETPNLYDH